MLLVFDDGFVMQYKGVGLFVESELTDIRDALFNVLQNVPNDILSDDDRCFLVRLLRSLSEGVVKREGKLPNDSKDLV